MLKRSKIWKLQRPIVTNEQFPTVLAYTEGKEQMAQIPLGEEFIEELFGDELKIYVRGSIKNGVLKVRSFVEEQPW